MSLSHSGYSKVAQMINQASYCYVWQDVSTSDGCDILHEVKSWNSTLRYNIELSTTVTEMEYSPGPIFYLCLKPVLDSNNLLLFLAETIWLSVAVLATQS